MTVKEDLSAVVGAKYVADDPQTLECYASDLSLAQSRRPSLVT